MTDDRTTQLPQPQRLELLGQLAGGIAHDFNNILAVIEIYAGLVGDAVTAAGLPEVAADAARIARASKRGSDLTRQLLSFARREVVRPQVLDLGTSVRLTQELLDRTLGENVELSTDLADGLWPVLADPGQVEQVLMNLAINARDAMPDGGVLRIDTANIEVDAESVAGGSPAEPGRYVRLRISDTGTGMTPEVLDRAFEPFYTTKADGAGTGLGLATVYGIVQSTGTITIKSEVGAGTTFTIMLPVTQETAEVIEDAPTYQRDPKGETVLVVEDDEDLREVTRRIFDRNGYQVLTAANGAAAIDLAASHDGPIHLLITDVVMPRMLGKEVAHRISESRPEIGVLFMSGYAQPVLASQGRLEPGVALLDKPFSEAALLEKAALVLNGHFRGFRNVRKPTQPL